MKNPMHADIGDARLDRRGALRRTAAGMAIPAALAAGLPARGASASVGAGEDWSMRRAQASGSGMSEDGLHRMTAALARDVANGAAPGLVSAVSRRGQAHIEAIGKMAFAGDAPMARDTIFRIASVSKPITAAATMMLVEDCVVRLDESVDALLPELANRQVLRSLGSKLDDTVPANRPITLRDLLTFRLGYGILFPPPGTNYPIQKAIAESGAFPDVNGGGILPRLTPDELMEAYGKLPLIHQPGEQFLYNSGADLLGVLIARATDMSFGEFLQERLFDPLGMKDTGFFVPAEKLDRLATVYWRDFSTGENVVFDDPENSTFASPPPFESGAGGLVSTADDLLAFGEMMLNNGVYKEQRLLSRPSVAVMTTDQITPEQKAASQFFPGAAGSSWEDRGWGFGMAVITKRDTLSATPGRYGWDGGWGTSWYVDPTEKLIGVLLTQRTWDGVNEVSLYNDFWTGAYAAIDD